MGLILLNIFINYVDDGAEFILMNFADDTKLGDTPEGFNAIWRDSDRLEKWANGNLIKFSRGK